MSKEMVQSSTAEKIDWARNLAVADLLPKQYRDKPGNLLMAAEYADSLGISRMNALTSIHIVEGKPTASADLIAGLVRRAGHKLRVSGNDTEAVAQIIRADDPEYTYEVRWDIKRAQVAGLAGKNVWKNYPAAMLRSRAITEVARMGASDCLLGIIYTAEEMGATVDQTGAVVEARQTTTADDVLAAPEPVESEPEVVEAEVVEDDPVETPDAPAKATTAQVAQIKRGVTANAIGNEAAKAMLQRVTGRDDATTANLTGDEATAILAELAAFEGPAAASADTARAAIGATA